MFAMKVVTIFTVPSYA